METPHRAGIQPVYNDLKSYFTSSPDDFERHLTTLLPPEHRITGVKEGLRTTEYLIEGPMLPVVAAGDTPSLVRINLTMATSPDQGKITLTGNWFADSAICDETPWLIREWTPEAFRAHATKGHYGWSLFPLD